MDSAVRLHKQLAMGESPDVGDSGVEKLANHSRGTHADAKRVTHKRTLKQPQRGAPPPVNVGAGKKPAQANPDHGPHDCY